MKFFITITAITIFITGCCCPTADGYYSEYGGYYYNDLQNCYKKCDNNYLSCTADDPKAKGLCKAVFRICVHNCTVE